VRLAAGGADAFETLSYLTPASRGPFCVDRLLRLTICRSANLSDKQELGAGTPPKEITAEQPPPTPDEDGPHDVPDEAVIEATLPATHGSTSSKDDAS
jgi:hypothetical protein